MCCVAADRYENRRWLAQFSALGALVSVVGYLRGPRAVEDGNELMTAQQWVERVSPTKLWKIFSPAVFGGLAVAGRVVASRLILGQLLQEGRGPKNPRVLEVYDSVYDFLSKNQPAEYFYKNALLQRSLLSRHGSRRSRVMFEFRAGGSKLDALVVRDSMHAYEIKTELDHFRRLPTQISDYKTRFANVWILSSARQAAALERSTDRSVGLAFVSSRHVFEVVREASRDTSKLKSDSILESLRRSEYVSVIRKFGFSEVGVPNTLLFSEAMKFSRNLDPELVHEETLARLRLRLDGMSAVNLSKLPMSVRAAAVVSKCSDSATEFLLSSLNGRVN